MAHKVFLEGGPDDLPERIVQVETPGEDVDPGEDDRRPEAGDREDEEEAA